ncbi:MAG: hypothetical protein AAGE59_35215 [Cyanobacteria bacterium P01_F01_bin.86]
MQHIQTHDDRASIAQEPHSPAQASELIEGELVEGAPYSGAQLAMELAIAESTFRTRWLPWLQKVAPMELLKTEDGYTELARSLALEFRQVPSKKAQRERWVTEAKERYSREFMPSGITPEGVSDALGGALALLRDQGGKLQTEADEQLQLLQALIESQSQVEAEFDEAEIEEMRASGMKRGVTRFQIETEAEDAAYYGLRKARSQARKPKQGKS